ncbi:MAG TPA: hypothetical protein VFP34_17860, partial [Microlunatus sp.]|nr:hypothetical protein [Microlunatus sp.]
MTTTTRKQTPAQARKSALESDFAPLYAVAGLADTLAAQTRTTLLATRERFQFRQDELESVSKTRVEELTQFVKSLPEQVKALPDTTKAKLAEAQEQFKTLYAEFATSYGDLAGRGKRAVDEALGSAKALTVKAEKQAEEVAADVAERIDPAFEKVQEGVTVARQKVTGRTATETVTPRSAARAQATRAAENAVAAEKAAARKAAAK